MIEVRIGLNPSELAPFQEFVDFIQRRREAAFAEARAAIRRDAEREPVNVVDRERTEAELEYVAENAIPTEPQPVIETEPAPTPAPVVEAAVPSEADAVAALRAYVQRTNVAAAVNLLNEFGVKRVGEIPAERRAAFIGRTAETAA